MADRSNFFDRGDLEASKRGRKGKPIPADPVVVRGKSGETYLAAPSPTRRERARSRSLRARIFRIAQRLNRVERI